MSRALKRIFHVEDELPGQDLPPSNSSYMLASNQEQNCVIECPSCATRFSLPLSTITDHEDPRFHCSQCDTIFRVDSDAASQAQGTIPEPTQKEIHHQNLITSDHNNPPAHTSQQSPGIFDTLVSESGDDSEAPQVFVSSSPSASHSSDQTSQRYALEESWPPSNTRFESNTPNNQAHSKSFEIPRSVDDSWSLGPPHETASQDRISEGKPDFFAGFAKTAAQNANPLTQTDLHKATEEPTQISLALKSEIPIKEAQSSEKVGAEISRRDDLLTGTTAKTSLATSLPDKKGSSAKHSRADRNAGEVKINRRQLLLGSVKKMHVSIPLGRWRAPLFILGPVIAFCVALVVFAGFLEVNPLRSEEVITAAIPGLTRVAPPGLAVIEAHLRKITLDSGELVYALSGLVKNNSGILLNRIQLDGLVFDERGALITEKQSLVASPLAQSKLRSLSIEMIDDIQANALKEKTVVKDGETAPFVVVFRPQEIRGAQYFSTRINSVR